MTEQESLTAAIHENVELREYNPAWPGIFHEEQQRLQSLFPDVFLDLQHIGSTAVPGLLAKPVVDLLAGVRSFAVARSLNEPLCRCCYATSAAYNASLADRQWFMRWSNGRRTHHLHVVVHDSAAWRERIAFRDALRADAELAARYGALKRALATTHRHDREAYTAAKAAFVQAASARNPSMP